MSPDRVEPGGAQMSPEEVGARLASLLEPAPRVEVHFGQLHVDVEAAVWLAAARTARDDPRLALDYFDWLSGVDELDAFTVVTHLYSLRHRHHLLLRTRVPRDRPHLPSLVGVFPGAAWHERETFEMFGIHFDDHADLRPLLLPDGFDGHPLRKDFVLAARVAKAWPGAKEPGESDHGAPSRRRIRPPGVPDPAEWGPQAVAAEPATAGGAGPGQTSRGEAGLGEAGSGGREGEPDA